MKKDEINLADLTRILIGEVPAEFYVELIIRTLFVYLFLTYGLKYMRKCVSGELTRLELVVVATLAAAGGLVLLTPERGLLPPLVILAAVMLVKKLIDKRTMRDEKFEHLTQGHLDTLVADGVISVKNLVSARISHEQLFAQLREQKVVSLGTVKRLYLEANGNFSIVKQAPPVAGIPVIPAWDKDFLEVLVSTGEEGCTHCGTLRNKEQTVCSNCGNGKWVTTVTGELK